MDTEVKQHVQLPTKMEKQDELEPKDLLIYLTIKRHENGKTKEAFPSLQRISELSGASIPTIRKIIKKLVDAGYMTVKQKGRQHVYSFTEYRFFEAFSYEFLDDQNLSFMQKAYIVSVTPLMMSVDDDTAVIHYTNKELAKRIHMPESTLSKIQRELTSKQCLQIVEDSLNKGDKVFNLKEFHQNVAFILRNHEERIENTEIEIQELKTIVTEQNKIIDKQNKQIDKLISRVNKLEDDSNDNDLIIM